MVVNEGEEVTGQVVAVLGSVRINGEVGDQVVAVLGTVELGPKAVVHGDVVTVGGRLRRAAGARVDGSVTEVALGDMSASVSLPWLNGREPFRFGGFGPVTRLIGTTFRIVLLALAACLALVVARRAVEGAAQRVSDEPIKATLVGFAAWVLFVPMLTLTAIVLSISIVGIPLLILLPFAVLILLLMALVGFSGTVSAIGQWARRRFGMGTSSGFVDVCLGILIVVLPLLVARFVAFGGWTLSPIVFLLVAAGLAVEFLAWSSGFGAVLTNVFSRWQAKRSARSAPHTVPTTPMRNEPQAEALTSVGDDLLEGPAAGARHLGAAPESHDEVRAPLAGVQPRAKLRAQRCDLDRLIHERVADAERRRLERETLVRAADLDPVLGVVPVREEDHDRG